MPEGDTVWHAARVLNEALAGRVVTACDIRVPRFAAVDLTGETVHSVVSRGKHLLMRVGGYSVHSHLKMEGTWEVYPPNGRWRHPAWQARIVLSVEGVTAVGFSLGKLEVLPLPGESEALAYLGPDLLGPDWDPAEAERRLRARGERAIGVALLDQRNLAGLGNDYRNELCFVRGLHPATPVAEVKGLERLVDTAHRMIQQNKTRVKRTTTGDTRHGRRLWVAHREGEACRRCATPIRRDVLGEDPLQLRDIYWCPHCQPEPPRPWPDGSGPAG